MTQSPPNPGPRSRPRSPSRPAVSIVIPTYNGKALLAACLASIEWCAPSHLAIEVIVVDDASIDDTADWVRRTHPWVRLVPLEQNAGFCRAANAGIAAATAPIIQLLNNDTQVSTGWLDAALAAFSDPLVGSVAPLVVSLADPQRVDSAGDGYRFFGLPFKRGSGQRSAVWRSAPADDVLAASGSSAFYRASALRNAGGFDPDFGAYYEDVDLGFRLRWAGYTCRFVPTSEILHRVSATYDHGSPRLQRQMARNAELIFWSRLPWPWLAASIAPHFCFLVAQAIHRACTRRFRPFILGKLDAARMLLTRRSRRCAHASRHSRPHFPITIALRGPISRAEPDQTISKANSS